MAFFGSTNSYVGIDIGTSNIKLVELLDRRRRIEVSTYAQGGLPNLLLGEDIPEEQNIRKVANVISHMMDKAGVSSDVVVAALPSSIVFSSVLMLPDLPDQEMEKAVRFAARDIVPSDLDDMVLGWSRVPSKTALVKEGNADQFTANATAAQNRLSATTQVPIFLTAAAKQVVDRYIKVLNMVHLKIEALEVETFPLARALLSREDDSALIVDMGDLATTFHVIDQGTPRVSHTIEYGGRQITELLAKALGLPYAQAETAKIKYGLSDIRQTKVYDALVSALTTPVQKALTLLKLYKEKEGKIIKKSFLIGGGANMRGLAPYWSQAVGHSALIGNPWKGLSYPIELEKKLFELGPTYAVAVGLALRKLRNE